MCFKPFPLLLTLLLVILTGCDNGSTSSGGAIAVTPTPAPAPPPAPTTRAGEFATDCMENIQVRRNGTALIQNVCPYPINVGQMNSRFGAPPPITEIPPGQLVAVKLADDQLEIGFGACRVPSIPEPAEPGFFRCSRIPIGSKSPADGQQAEVLMVR